MTETINNGIQLTVPVRGETDWDSVVKTYLEKISGHDHTGGGNGTQLAGSSFPNDAFDDQKTRLRNNQFLRARNALGS